MPRGWSVGERGHDLAGKASQALSPSLATSRSTAVDQHVADADVAELLESLRDFVGSAVHGTVLVDGPGIPGGAIRAAEHRAVGPRGELQLADPILQPAFQGSLSLLGGIGHEECAGHPNLHRVEAAATSLHLRSVGGNMRGHARERRILPEEQVEPLGGDPADRTLAARAHPDLRMRLLRWWRFDDDVVELPVLTPIAEGLVGSPRLQQNLEALVEPRVGLLHRHAEARELVVPVALPDPEIEPAPGQKIERRGLFGQQHRVVPWQHHHRSAETEAARTRPEPGEETQRGRDLTISGEVVLHDERAVKAERLGLHVVFDEIAKSLAAVEFRPTAPR